MTKVASILEIPATITERGQTTVPAAIRRMLALGKRDRVVFKGMPDGTVVISKLLLPEDLSDPVLSGFLDFLERDIERSPQRLQPMPRELFERARNLIAGIEVDLDAALPDDEE